VGCWCSPEQSPGRTALRVARAMQQAELIEVQRNVVDDPGQLPALADVERALHAQGSAGIRKLLAAAEYPTVEVAAAAQVTLPAGHVVALKFQQGCWLTDEVS
jgi:hypothetical protein